MGSFAPQTLIAYFQNAGRFFVKPFASLDIHQNVLEVTTHGKKGKEPLL